MLWVVVIITALLLTAFDVLRAKPQKRPPVIVYGRSELAEFFRELGAVSTFIDGLLLARSVEIGLGRRKTIDEVFAV